MSLIEDAAKRLEELRRAGVRVASERPEIRSVGRRPAPETFAETSASSPNGAGPAKLDAPSRQVTIDLKRLAAAGYLAPGAPRSSVADEFRVIKRPLITNASGGGAAPVKNGNLIMVTSALPNEGKTFTAVNLALSMANELDRTVLLVDADVARPAMPELFGLPASRGLLDVLQDKNLDIGQFLLRTNIPNLTLLPGGTQTPHATELLASGGMVQVLDEMAKRYSDRIIVFDTPPLLVTTEARALAEHMGQIVFVVKAESTLQSQVAQALAAIEACPVKLAVLNMVESRAQGAYGWGYGYGYGS
jgi:exopolysaccharide/PEP-CTERM locus tyrosine autokinase